MRRPSVLAVICVVLAAVSTGLLAGCDGGPTPGSEAAVARQKANDTVIRQLEALPEATVTAHVTSSLDGGQNNVNVQARLPAAATVAQANALGDSIERTIWLSHLDPMGRISIYIIRQGSRVPVQQRLYQDEIDTRPLGVKYGPRPDGLPG
jgi:hypothetical protein